MLDFTNQQRLLSRAGWGLFASAALMFTTACGPDCKEGEIEVDGECRLDTTGGEVRTKARIDIALDSSSSNGVEDNNKIDFNVAREYEVTATVTGRSEGFDQDIEGLPIVFSYDGDEGIFEGESSRTVNTNANGVAVVTVTSTTDARNQIISVEFAGNEDIAREAATVAVNFCSNCEVTSPVETPPGGGEEGPTDEMAQAAIRGFAFEGPFLVGEGETAVLILEAFDDAGAVLPGVDVYISVNDPLQLKTALDPVKGPNGLATTDADGRIRISVTPRQGASGIQTILAMATRPDGSTATATRQLTIASNRAPTNILFTASPQIIQPSNTNKVALEAIVLDDLGHPMPSAQVTFEITDGPGTDKSTWGYVEELATQEGAEGAEATYFAGTATGTVTIQVSTQGAAGVPITKAVDIVVSTSAPAAVTNSAEDQAQDALQLQTAMIAIQPDSTFVQSDGVSQIGIDVKPLGAGNQSLEGVIVHFLITGGSMPAAQRGSINPGQAKSDNAGLTSLTYTAGTVTGTVTIQAEVRLKTTGALITSNSVVLNLTNDPIEVQQVASIAGIASSLSVEPLSLDPVRVTAYPLNASGLLIEGDYVTFTLLTAGAGRLEDAGDNQVDFYPSSLTGTVQIQACAGSVQCTTVSVDVQPDSGLGDVVAQEAIQQSAAYLNLTAVGSAVVLSGTGNTLVLNAQVMDASNGVVEDAIVTYRLSAGPSGNRAEWGAVDTQSRTGSDGIADAVYYAASVTGSVTVEATIRSVPGGAILLTDTLVIQVDAATNAADQAQDLIQQQVAMLDILPATTVVQNDGVSQIDIVVKPIGSANQTLADVIVDFSISGGSMAAAGRGSITPGQDVSNASGVTSLLYTAGTVAGTVTIQADVRLKTTGAVLVSNSVTLTLINQPIEVLQVASISGIASTLALEPQALDPSLITAYPLNGAGLLVGGDFVTFTLLTAGDSGRLVDTGNNEVEYYAGTVTGPIDIQLCAGVICDTVQIVVQPDNGLGNLAEQEAIQQSAAYLNLTAVGPAVVLSGSTNTLVLNAQVMDADNGVVDDAIVRYALTAGPTGNRAEWGAVDVQSRTGSNGIAEALYYGAAVTGLVTVEATVRSVTTGAILLTDTLVVQVDAATSSDQTAEVSALILTSNRVSVKPGFANTVEISAQALNATNNPLTELFVYFDLVTGPTGDRSEWGSILYRGEPDAQGVATTNYYAGTATGDVWVRAQAGAVTEYLKLTIDVNAGDSTAPGGSSVEQEARQSNVAALVLMADNDNLPLGPNNSTQIHVWPIGSDNTPQPDVIVSFSVVTGPTLVAQSDWGMIDGNVTTDDSGKGAVTYLAGNFAGPVTVRAQARSVIDATIYAEAYYTINLQSAQSDAEALTQVLHLVAEPSTVEQNSTEPMVIRGIALDSNNALIEGDFIEFALIEAGTPAQVGYIAKGTEDNTVLYYPGSQTGGITIEARANGLTQTIDAFVVVPATISPDALQASVTRLILTKSAPSVDQGPTHAMDILAWAVNSNNNPLTGVKVNFAVINGPTLDPANWGGVDQEATTDNGLATAEYFAGFETGTVTVRAWVARITDSSIITQTTVDIPVVAAEVADETPYVDSIVMRLDQTEVQPGFSNSVDVEAMVLNALGNPLNNVTVDFRLVAGPAGPQSAWGAIQTSVSPSNGIAKTTYFAGTATGAVTIEASVGGVSTQAVITVSNNAVTVDTDSIAQEALQSTVSALVVTLDKSSLNLGPDNIANVTVFPIGSDSTPVLGAKVGFTIVSATSGTRPQWGVIEGSATTTNGSGSVSYYAGTTDTTVTIRAFVRSVTDANLIYAQQDVTIDLVDPIPAQATVVDIALSLEEGMVLPGVTSKIKVWAQPINAFGNPVENIPVTFALISGPTGSVVDWGSIEGSATSDNGVAEVLYTAGSVTGAVEIQASVGGVIVSTFVNVVLSLPSEDTDIQVQEARQRAAAYIALSADPVLVSVPSVEFSTVEAFVLTSNNNLLEGVTVEFNISGSTFVSQADWGGITAEGDTDASGRTQVFYVPADVSSSGTVTVEAVVRSVTNPTEILLTQTLNLTVQPDQDDAGSVASLAFFANGLVLEPGESLDLNAVALDGNNNPLTNLSVAFAVTGGTAVNPEEWGFVGALARPAANGIATTTFQASQTVGYVWVDATVGAITRTLQIQVAGPTVDDDTASVASIILASSAGEVEPGLGSNISISAMAVDAQGRPLRNVVFDFQILNATAVSGAVDFDGVPGDSDGIATATYRAGSVLGPVAIRASVGAVTAQLSILVTDSPNEETVSDASQQAVQNLVVIASPATYVLGEDDSSDISVLTMGANNAALDGVIVDLAVTSGPGTSENWGLIDSRVESQDGVASASYRLPQATGTVTIEAYVRSVTDFSVIATNFTTINVVNPGAPVDDTALVANLILAASPSEVAPGLGNPVEINAMAVDAQGSPLRDLVIDFEILSPTAVSGAIDGGTGVPGANGVASATYYAGSALGPIAIRATVGLVSAQITVVITNTPNPEPIDDAQQQAVQTVVVIPDPATLILGTDTESAIQVLTLGADNVALDNVIVDLAITGGPGTNDLWGFIDGRIESADGVARATYQSPLATGVVTIEAYVRSVTDFSLIATGYTTITVANSPVVLDDSGLVANLILTSDKTEVSPGLEHRVEFSAMAVDAQGNPLRNLTINYEILSPTAVSGAIDGGTGVPGASGIASATYYAGTGLGVVTIRATAGAVSATRNVLVTNTPNPVSADDSKQQAVQTLVVVANPAQVDVGVEGETEVRILTLGADNVALDDVIVDLAITNGPGSVDNWGLIAGSATSVDGVAVVSYGAALQTGTVTIEAYVRSVTDFSTVATGFTTISVVDPNAPIADDSALVANLILTSDKTEVSPGLEHRVEFSAMAVDAQGNPLRNLTINYEILSPTAVSGAIDGGTGVPGASGIANATYYAGTGLGVVTIRATAGAVSATRNVLVTNTPNPVSADDSKQQAVQTLVVVANPAQVDVGVEGETEVRILTLGADNVALDDVIVDLAITNGPGSVDNWGLIAGSATSVDGVAVVSYGAALQTGTVTIEAYVRSVTDFSTVATGFTTISVVDPNAPTTFTDDSTLVTNLIVSVNPNEVAPGIANTVDISAMAVDALGRPLSDLALTFEILSPTVVSGAVDGGDGRPGANGIASAKYYAGAATGTVTVRVTAGAVSETLSILVTNTPNVEPVDNTIQNSVAYLVLMADPASLVPGSGDSAQITAWALNSNNNPVQGAQVDVYLVAGPTGNQGNWGAVGANIDTDADGMGSVNYTAGLVAGTVTVRADVRTLDSLALVTSTTINVALAAAPVASQEAQIAAIIVDADPRVMEPGVSNQSDVFMMAVDAVGNVLTEVDFDVTIVGADAVSGAVQGLAIPDASGIATAKYYAGSATGTVRISVAAGSVVQTIDLSIVDNLADDTAQQELVQQSVQYIVLSSDVFQLDAGFDQYASLSVFAIGTGNVPVADARVELEILSGPGGIANQDQWGLIESPVLTDASGLADALYAASTITGTVTIRASIKSVLTGATITSTTLDLTIMESDLQQQINSVAYLVLSAAPGLLELNGDDIESTISALVIDGAGHALDQVPVTIEVLDGPGGPAARGSWGAVYPATMVKNGISNTSTYSMGTTTGTITLLAWAGAVSATVDLVISNNPNIDAASIVQDNLHQEVTYLLLTSSAASSNTGSTNSVIFTATAMNANNNPLNGVVVDFAITGHSGTAQAARWGSIQGPLTTANGRASATYTASDVTGTVTVEATVYSVLNPAVVYAVTSATVELVEGTALTNSELLVSSIVLESTLLSVEQGLQNAVVVRAAPINAQGHVLYDVPLYYRIVNGPTAQPQEWGVVEASALVPAGNAYAEANYFAGAATGMVELEVRAGSVTRTVEVRVDPSSISTDTNGNQIMTSGSIILTSNRDLVAEGISHSILLSAIAFGEDNQPVPAGTDLSVRIVSHSATTDKSRWGVVQPLDAGTDADGIMEIRYYASLDTGTVVIEVFSGAITQQISIDVVEDRPSYLNVTIVPGSLEADGTSQADVLVTALDIYGDPVPDGTRIRLTMGYADFGYLSASVVQTTNGQVTVQYTAPVSGGVDGTQTITASLGTVTASRQIQIIDLRVTTIGVLAQPQTLEIGQQGYVLATLRDVLGQPVAAGTGVTFASSSTHVVLLNSFAPSDESGIAQITIVADAVTSAVEVTAYVYGVAGLMTDSTIISVQPPASGTISYESANPTVVGVRGASSFGNGVIQETSVITFRVQTSYGQAVPDGTLVEFQIDGPVGAELLQTSATTLNGLAATTIRSGTVSGTIRVLAEVDFSGTPFFAWSAPVGVQAGPPVQNHISIAFGFDQNGWAISVPGKSINGYVGKIGAYLSDRFNNPVPEGTQVYFTTEAGIIEANASTDSLGRVEVDYVTANPAPVVLGNDRDLATAPHGGASAGAYVYQREISAAANSNNNILLVAIGEESFTDTNGNGIYDMGEPIGDTSEPFLDTNDDNVRNSERTYFDDDGDTITAPDEPFWDYDEDGVFDQPNGIWDSRAFVWAKGSNIWFGPPAAGYVLPSRFIDMNADGQYHQDDGDMMLVGGNAPGGLTMATMLCGAPVNVTAATYQFTSDLRVDFVIQDQDGMLPGGWGIESMAVSIDIGLDGLEESWLTPQSAIVLTAGDAYSNRARALVKRSGTGIPEYGLDSLLFNRVTANAASFNASVAGTLCHIP